MVEYWVVASEMPVRFWPAAPIKGIMMKKKVFCPRCGSSDIEDNKGGCFCLCCGKIFNKMGE